MVFYLVGLPYTSTVTLNVAIKANHALQTHTVEKKKNSHIVPGLNYYT